MRQRNHICTKDRYKAPSHALILPLSLQHDEHLHYSIRPSICIRV